VPVNADKPHLWKKDIAASVDFYNNWFIKFAPKTFRDTRTKTAETVIETFKLTGYLKDISTKVLEENPAILSILIEAKSAGDFRNPNKRRKEEATKITQLHRNYGEKINYILFLCGYFDSGYLGYEAAEGIDWIWEHRIDDLELLKL